MVTSRRKQLVFFKVVSRRVVSMVTIRGEQRSEEKKCHLKRFGRLNDVHPRKNIDRATYRVQ